MPLLHITICFIPPSTISNLIASDLLSKLLSINFFIISVTEGIDIFEYIYDIVSSSNFFNIFLKIIFYFLRIKFINYLKIFTYIISNLLLSMGIEDWRLGPIPNPQNLIKLFFKYFHFKLNLKNYRNAQIKKY